MLNRRQLLQALAMSATLAPGSIASAADRKAFDQGEFEAAQRAGTPILVEIWASWCPICKAQAPTLSRLRSESRFKELVSFGIDFDAQKNLLKTFNVQKQSTLIVFKGKQEVGRSTGETNAAAIEALLDKAI
jgi:thiol-disulfide isomerase/thioredoxin